MINKVNVDIRHIKVNDSFYLKKEDIVTLLLEFFSAEETVVRVRGYELIRSISSIKG